MDGFDDISAVSNYVNIFLGDTSLDITPDISISFWAVPVCGLGDINGDSYVDIGLGRAAGWDPTGRVYIYSYGKENSIEDKMYFNHSYIFNLHQNYPNPFNINTIIKYELALVSRVSIEILNCIGQKIITLIDKRQVTGYYSVIWDGTNNEGLPVVSGVYFMRITTHPLDSFEGKYIQIRKMVLLK